MQPMYTQIISNIQRSKGTGMIWAGTHLCQRVVDVKVRGGKHGWLDRTVVIQMRDGVEYTVVQPDRGFFELRGPGIKAGLEVAGWSEAVRMVDQGL